MAASGLGRTRQLPATSDRFSAPGQRELEAHVTDKALDGLFHVIAQKEEHIRNNVVARTSDLLKKVFATQDDKADGERKRWWEKY